MPFPAFILLTAILLPLVAAGILIFFGAPMAGPRSKAGGTALAGWVATTAIVGSFLCSLLAMVQWVVYGAPGSSPWGWKQSALLVLTRWLPIGPASGAPAGPPLEAGWLHVGFYIDSLTIAMFGMVTLVALLVHVFAIGYMRGDARFARFFAYLSLFCFAMLGLLSAGTLLQLFVFWELVGLCSYLLIGFWTERPAAGRAATKAFIVNRVGDAGFLIGFGLLLHLLGNASLPHVWAALGSAGRGQPILLADGTLVSTGMLTAIGVCLFVGAAGKSAQFPLHTWLPDAMEGPTPVSALIHAATMVVAGVYLVARIFPLLTPDAKLVIAVIGCVTLLMGALIAMVQTDIKRVLAYSTISQLGFMMLAIGVGSWVGALFHLITHAFFKALLFLGAGSVIHAARHQQDMRQYGGLWRQIPVTAASFLVGVMAISGVGLALWGSGIGLSGYYSKGHMLTDIGAFAGWATSNGRSDAYWLLLAVPVLVAYLTPFYMTRVWMLTFWGRPRNVPLYGRAREAPMFYVPLLALAFMSGIAGWQVMNIRPLLEGAMVESTTAAEVVLAGSAAPMSSGASQPTERRPLMGWASVWPTYPPGAEPKLPASSVEVSGSGDSTPIEEPTLSASPSSHQSAHASGLAMEHRFVGWAWIIGAAAAIVLYSRGLRIASRIADMPLVRPMHRWLLHGMYIDELWTVLLVRPILFGAALFAWLDRHVLDAAVNRSATIVRQLSRLAGWNDRQIVDGAVVGVSQLAWEIGTAARAPQTGRVRAYVATLLAAVVIGLAVTVAVMVWK